jgi:hypothetical protein
MNPMVATVTALDDWTSAVTMMPEVRPRQRVFVDSAFEGRPGGEFQAIGHHPHAEQEEADAAGQATEQRPAAHAAAPLAGIDCWNFMTG